ncbi:MAG: hypothetical protein P8L85_05770 [Rubripirellula sp.]|nr:hypothetical protein [Rubripirellula sp.]
MTVSEKFDWRQFPDTQRWVAQWIDQVVDAIPFLATLQARMGNETGTQLQDWVDHLVLGESRVTDDDLISLGFARASSGIESVWCHAGGLFPKIQVAQGDELRLALKVDSVSDFLFAHQLDATIDGAPQTPCRTAVVAQSGSTAVLVIERHGTSGMEPSICEPKQVQQATAVGEAFRLRRRDCEDDQQGFDEAFRLIETACDQIGVDWACSLFFAAEREYWQWRNRAAQTQDKRQNRLGLGWANHDHHTYRSSREHFASLVKLLERLGMKCRERFYGGAEAGWGAQVLEQPVAGIVVFADVDLSPEEVAGDFAHEGLQAQASLGTVGMWCKLHGEAILQAGMHHLECQFDFKAARDQLADQGIESMAPFTDFDHLKQSFTQGEKWPVTSKRLNRALEQGWITSEQAERFRHEGSLGSHLEVLQRWDGYKGFNQTGISDIIRKTDPRLETS